MQVHKVNEHQPNGGSLSVDSRPTTTGAQSFLSAQDLSDASSATILVAISFHFLPNRLVYLQKVLASFANFPVERCEIVVFTNTKDPEQHDALRNSFRMAEFLEGQTIHIQVAENLDHPFNLTWSHKGLIANTFLANDSSFSHFIYLEDDEELSFAGFAYFLAARNILRKFGLIPALVRVEWNADQNIYVAADNIAPVDLATRPFVGNGTYAFLEPQNVYYGGFILDRELAAEYLETRSFSIDESLKVTNWMVRERSAMGLTFEKPPRHFIHRAVIPVSIASRTVPECAWLPHLPNNFVSNPNTEFGKLPMSKLFYGTFIETPADSPDYELHVKRTWPILRRHLLARGKKKLKIFLKKLFPASTRLG